MPSIVIDGHGVGISVREYHQINRIGNEGTRGVPLQLNIFRNRETLESQIRAVRPLQSWCQLKALSETPISLGSDDAPLRKKPAAKLPGGCPSIVRVGEGNIGHNHGEWLRFLKQIDQDTPKELDLHLILDNYGTHKEESVRKWLSLPPGFTCISRRPVPPGGTWQSGSLEN